MPETSHPRGLDGLPCEIQLQICTELCVHCSGGPSKKFDRWADGDDNQRTLLALSRTSRTFHRLAQPIAFHRFQQIPTNWSTNAFVKFARTLIERPDLAGQVKELCQHCYECGGWSNQQDFSMLKAAADRLGMASVDDPDFQSAEEEDLSPGKFCMELLLALLPNLETLHLMFEDQGNYEQTTYTYLQRRLNKLGSDGTLKRLRRVVFDTEENWGFFFSIPAVGVLHQVAPNLDELVIRHNKGFESMDLAESNLRAMFSGPTQSLRTLRLDHCALSNDSLSTSFLDLLIRHAPKLENFSYRSQTPYFGEGLGTHLTPREMIKCLRPLSDTLKSIDIDLTDHMEEDQDRLVTGRSLAKFEKLEELKLDEQAFCRHYEEGPDAPRRTGDTCLTDLVPPSLKVLTVRLYDDTCLYPDLEELVSSSSRKFPNLKKMIIHTIWRMGSTATYRDCQDAVRAKGQAFEDFVSGTHLELEMHEHRYWLPDVY
ncbi:hypothetical protein CEP51_014569 [Fusarium floridanum]|uniref:F-box domain-containing protein n=1 Tax=Fusarium floridanum TaxID=1325733 RepID=A0A428PQD2_9HYPO|nr:hypothetical protein CEP51_014569 [Fusarium floridanum]